MRSLFLKQVDWVTSVSGSDKGVEISGDKFHHLVHVVRVKVGETLLILNPIQNFIGVVENISKKAAYLKFLREEIIEDKRKIDLALGLVKRDALELIVRSAVELGIGHLHLLQTDFSQRYSLSLQDDRWQRLIENAMEQSNNPYAPQLQLASFDQLEQNGWGHYSKIICFTNQIDPLLEKSSEISWADHHSSILYLIGPEGGFSVRELALMKQHFHKFHFIFLSTYILRSPTAVATGLGYIQGLLASKN